MKERLEMRTFLRRTEIQGSESSINQKTKSNLNLKTENFNVTKTESIDLTKSSVYFLVNDVSLKQEGVVKKLASWFQSTKNTTWGKSPLPENKWNLRNKENKSLKTSEMNVNKFSKRFPDCKTLTFKPLIEKPVVLKRETQFHNIETLNACKTAKEFPVDNLPFSETMVRIATNREDNPSKPALCNYKNEGNIKSFVQTIFDKELKEHKRDLSVENRPINFEFNQEHKNIKTRIASKNDSSRINNTVELSTEEYSFILIRERENNLKVTKLQANLNTEINLKNILIQKFENKINEYERKINEKATNQKSEMRQAEKVAKLERSLADCKERIKVESSAFFVKEKCLADRLNKLELENSILSFQNNKLQSMASQSDRNSRNESVHLKRSQLVGKSAYIEGRLKTELGRKNETHNTQIKSKEDCFEYGNYNKCQIEQAGIREKRIVKEDLYPHNTIKRSSTSVGFKFKMAKEENSVFDYCRTSQGTYPYFINGCVN